MTPTRTRCILRAAASVATFLAVSVPIGASPPVVASLGPTIHNVRVESARPAPGGLEAAIHDLAERSRTAGSAETEWVAWSVAAVEGHHGCCWSAGRRGCCLDGSHEGTNFERRRASGRGPSDDRQLLVLLRLADGEIDRVAAYSSDCPIDGAGRVLHWLGAMDPRESLDLLDTLVERGTAESRAVTAIALHAEEHATEILERLARSVDRSGDAVDESVAQGAVFWLGAARRRPGYEALSRLLAEDPGVQQTKRVVFALSQSPVAEAGRYLERLARHDPRREVRKEALFWVAQRGDPGAARLLLSAAAEDSDAAVREHAIFALSQLPDNSGTLVLLDVVKDRSFDPGVRNQAIFWLAQSNDPRALDFLTDVLRGTG